MPSDHWHNLALYQMAVQHPLSEAFFLARAYEECNDFQQASVLREDFCGSAAVSLAWVLTDPDRKAIAIDNDPDTIAYARRQIDDQPDDTGQHVHLLCKDVLDVAPPQVLPAHIIASLNFSTLIFHDDASLLGYLKRCYDNLTPGGIFVMDLFGGEGAKTVSTQTRELDMDEDETVTYQWEQRSYDRLTQRIDCRIHFVMPDGTERRDAFVYDWRLWEVPELLAILRQAGFARREIWSDTLDADGMSDGYYQPTDSIPDRRDWVIYLIAQKPANG